VRGLLSLVLLVSMSMNVQASISHGPVLGDLSEKGIAIWVRTTEPGIVNLQIVARESKELIERQATTVALNDNTHIFRVSGLRENTDYEYKAFSAGQSVGENVTGRFKTLGANIKGTSNRTKGDTTIIFGSCYSQGLMKREKGQIFKKILEEGPDAVIILGDVPYSDDDDLETRRDNHKVFRENPYFSALSASVPLYAIWDDHDFGTDNVDSTFSLKDESLKVFTEYWPNPLNENRQEKGIYTSFIINNIEVFMLDTRYHSLQSENAPQLLGEKQFSWLCNGLKSSQATYKVIASGVPLASDRVDGWSGKYYESEKERLFSCINENEISGVLMISGDMHRTEVHQFKLNGWTSANTIYDFSSSPFKSRIIKREDWFESSLVYSYDEEDSLYSELVFAANDKPVGIEFTLISPTQNRLKTISLTDKDLNINKAFGENNNVAIVILLGLLSIILAGTLYRGRYVRKS